MDAFFNNPLTGQWIECESSSCDNPYSKDRVTFVKSPLKDCVQFVWTIQPGGKMSFAHRHLGITETVQVLSGQCTLYHNPKHFETFSKGQTFTIHPGEVHRPGNDAHETCIALVTIAPAGMIKGDIETLYGLAKAGHCNREGCPCFAQLVVLNAHHPKTFLPYIPIVLQRILVLILAPIFRRCGYKARYKDFKSKQ